MPNGKNGGFPHEMDPKRMAALMELPCDDRVIIFEQIIGLYSNYQRDCRLAREALSAEINALIDGALKKH